MFVLVGALKFMLIHDSEQLINAMVFSKYPKIVEIYYKSNSNGAFHFRLIN